ncbi:MAG: SpoIVB peptidase S55 domain-containing protein [Sandaracinaceae bacterium]
MAVARGLLRRQPARLRVAVPAALFFAWLVAAVAFGQVRSPDTRLIGVEEITPGMRGYGLTVFRGTQPTRFDVEVIDVLHQFRPDQDLILVRTDHPILDSAHVVGGMSGSPIYFDGRLAGAYAYGWPFSNDPVAGVTPIRNMLTEMRRGITPSLFPGARPLGAPTPVAARTGGLAGLPPYLGEEPAHAATALAAHGRRLGIDPTGPRNSSTLEPAATPLMIGGMTADVIEQLGGQLERFGLTALQAGGAGPATPPASAPTQYTDGGAIGVQLVRGDIAATAVGTVTHVDGNRLAAFGHPMINAGQTGLPTSIARVLHILSSSQRSFKISEPVRPLGTLVHDRQSAIVVHTDLEAAGVDVVVRVHGVEGAPRTEWRFTVASHRVLTPLLLASSLLNAVQATASDNAPTMVQATSRLWVEGRSAPEEVTDTAVSLAGANAPTLARLRLYSLLEAAYGNPFEPSRATRVEVDLHLRFGRETRRIIDASVASREVDPGEMVTVRVVSRGWDQEERVEAVEVAIPEELAGETVELRVEGGSAVRPQTPQPRSLEDLFAAVQLRYPSTSIVVSVATPARGLRFPGHVARHLPASALDALQLTNDGDRNRPFVTWERHERPGDLVVSGVARLQVQVRSTPRP